jgi:hypothetical protein
MYGHLSLSLSLGHVSRANHSVSGIIRRDQIRKAHVCQARGCARCSRALWASLNGPINCGITWRGRLVAGGSPIPFNCGAYGVGRDLCKWAFATDHSRAADFATNPRPISPAARLGDVKRWATPASGVAEEAAGRDRPACGQPAASVESAAVTGRSGNAPCGTRTRPTGLKVRGSTR